MDCFAAPEVAEAQQKENMFQAGFGYSVQESKMKQGVANRTEGTHTCTHARTHLRLQTAIFGPTLHPLKTDGSGGNMGRLSKQAFGFAQKDNTLVRFPLQTACLCDGALRFFGHGSLPNPRHVPKAVAYVLVGVTCPPVV